MVVWGRDYSSVPCTNNRGLPIGITDTVAQPELDQVQSEFLQSIFPKTPSSVALLSDNYEQLDHNRGNPKKATKPYGFADSNPQNQTD